MPTPIKGSEISFEGNETTIISGEGGKALRNGLIQKQVMMFSELVQDGAIVRPSEISIDDHGRVIIKNEKWSKILKERVKKTSMTEGANPSFFDTNCQCGGK